MKKYTFLFLQLQIFTLFSVPGLAQNSGKQDVFQKANNTVNKVSNVIAVFQPYLLKARQLFYDAKQLAGEVKNASKTTFGKNGNIPNTGVNGGTYTTNNSGQYNNGNDSAYNNNQYNNGTNSNGNANLTNNGYPSQNANYPNSNTANGSNGTYQNNVTAYNQSPQNYLPNQSLPVNNPATVNNDGSGNWGNQNNGLYGNYLDVLTGTVMGSGEAETTPKSVDMIFVAANGSYQLWTPNYARNETAAEYTSRSTHESVSKWSDVNETEIAETRISVGQFDQIQNNSQILNAVKNAQNYGSSITEFSKLDGKVYAVKAELENRTVYGLIAVVKQIGTEGSNGYLKIKIKSQGIDNSQNGQLDANSYRR